MRVQSSDVDYNGKIYIIKYMFYQILVFKVCEHIVINRF